MFVAFRTLVIKLMKIYLYGTISVIIETDVIVEIVTHLILTSTIHNFNIIII